MPTGYDSTPAREQSLLVQLELLERDAELAVVADVIGAIRHGGRLLAIQGPPGPASGSRMPKSINERSFMPCGKRPAPPSAWAVADRGQLLGQAATEGRHECEEA